MTVTVNISGQNINTSTLYVLASSASLHDALGQRSTFICAVRDKTGTRHYQPGQPVTVTDTFAVSPFNPTGLIFTGYINDSSELELVPNTDIVSTISCIDQRYLADKRVSQTDYTGWFAGDIVSDLLARYLSQEGVLANYALKRDSTASDFSLGIVSNVTGALNVGDGDLELAPAGSTVTIAENTTATFGSGVLTNCSASNTTLVPNASKAVKIQGTCSQPGSINAYTYVQIWNGSHALVSNDFINYDIWIDPSSPSGQIGVDMTFTDGTTWRDTVANNDVQNQASHPNVDLRGLATGQWYHRNFFLAVFNGKTVQSVTVAIEGDSVGTYTGWIKNIYLQNNGTPFYFFQTSLTTNPPQQMQNNGYSQTVVSVVNTYDLSSSSRVSTAYSIDAAKLLRTSYLVWIATEPANTQVVISYSIDGGLSYIQCTNRANLPLLPAGTNGAGKSLYFRQQFTFLATVTSPELAPTLNQMQVTIQPSYVATKRDVLFSIVTGGGWAANGTLTNTANLNDNNLSLNGYVRNFDTGSNANQSFYFTNSASEQGCDNRRFSLFNANASTVTVSRMDFAGQITNFTMEFDVLIDNAAVKYSCVYRSSALSNTNGSFAYAVEATTTTIQLFKGQNAVGGGTITGLGSPVTLAVTSGNWHRIKVIVSGNSHIVYFDGVQVISLTDSTYSGSGYVGLRQNNGTATNYRAFFDNFGVIAALTGTWVSNNQSLANALVYGGSVISWRDQSTDVGSTDTVLVETQVDGSTWHTATNGSLIPGLTIGQSLSSTNLKVRVTLTTSTASSLPQLDQLTALVLGQLSASGSRVGLPLSLSNVGNAGATLVSWNAVVPTGTTLNVDTSLNGTVWTNIGGGAQGGAPIAGIVSQLDALEDLFNKQSASFYTNTSQSGGQSATWTWDTANSRILASGGNTAFLLYSGLIAQDVDVLADMDEADSCGLVWRQVDNRNFYDVVVQDASSPTPNQIVLNKVTGGVRTQIANASITFARGTPHRLRVTMLGSVITVYFDGIQMLTYTDLHPLGAGITGLCNDSIVGSGVGRFYRFRVQPQGDSVVGKNVFTRVRMTSTDPTVTPQLLDITTSVHSPNIGNGAFIPSTTYSVLNGSTNTIASDLDDLAKQSNYWWRIFNFQIDFQARNAQLSPWIVTGDDIKRGLGAVQVDNTNDLYRNSSWVLGGTDTQLVSQTFTGDGITQSWNMDYPVESLQSVTVDTNAATFGIQGVDTGKQFYYTVGNNTITQDITQSPYLSGQSLFFSYNASENVAVNAQDASLIAARAAIDKTSGIVEVAETASGLNSDAATQLAQSRIIQYGVDGQGLQFPVIRPGLGVGQLASVFWEQYGIVDGEYLITDCSVKWITMNQNGKAIDQPVYTISCTSGPVIASWTTYQAGLHK